MSSGGCFSALQRAENSSIHTRAEALLDKARFSALQRAENSSIIRRRLNVDGDAEFQCSSASRKFLNDTPAPPTGRVPQFQCSSASRKFLNSTLNCCASRGLRGFSALQRAENSSIVQVVLLVEISTEFQCSSASRKFLNRLRAGASADFRAFQCSSASRKFLNSRSSISHTARIERFSALQRAENSSIDVRRLRAVYKSSSFSALQRAENSSISFTPTRRKSQRRVSVLFSEPKIPQS